MCKPDLTKLENYEKLRASDKAILDLVIAGKSNLEICSLLYLGDKNLERRLSTIYSFLGIEKTVKGKRVSLFVKILNSLG